MLDDQTNGVPGDLARLLGGLILRPQDWIYRRVEQVSYVDQGVVSRRISIDFEVPRLAFEGPLYLPIALLAKRKLTNFDIRDASRRSLTMLTAEENSRLSGALLLAIARFYAGDLVDSVAEEYVLRLVAASTEAEQDLAWRRIFQEGTSVGACLRGEPLFVAVARDLARNFVLYLPVSHREAGERKIVKFSFESSREELSPRRSGLRARLGWTSVPTRFNVPLVGYCRSYHFELDAPPEMEITRGVFFATQERSEGKRQPIEDVAFEVPCVRAHFKLSRADRLPGRVYVSFRVRSKELLGGAALLAVLTALALLFVLLRLEHFLHDRTPDAAVAALLALPGVLIGFVTRPREHPVLTGFLNGFRLAATVSALTAFAGALVLFADYPTATLRWIFGALVGIASLAGLALSGSWIARRN